MLTSRRPTFYTKNIYLNRNFVNREFQKKQAKKPFFDPFLRLGSPKMRKNAENRD